MTIIDIKAKALEEAKAREAACEQKIKGAEKKIANIEAPYDDKISALTFERNEKTKDLHEALRGYEKDNREAHDALIAAQRAYDEADWENVIPGTFKDFCGWFEKVGVKKYSHGRYCMGKLVPFKGPKVEGLTVWTGKEKDTESPEKVYGAWVTATGKFLGYLWINPAKHIGDNTDAHGFVDGKQIAVLESYWVKKPLAVWVEALKFALHPEKAPIWRAVKMGEALPLGAIVRVASYVDKSFEYGIIICADREGNWYNNDRDTMTLYSSIVEAYNPENKSGTRIIGCADVQVDKDGNIMTIEQVKKAGVV